jgi:uncharacterized membrane protein YjjB (DUF3815 family)
MNGLNSVLTDFASIVIAFVTLLGLGVLFVKATSIERKSLVSTVTLMFNVLAYYMLVTDTRDFPGRELPTSIAAIAMSLIGYMIGRAIDDHMGARETLRRGPGALGDMAD